MSHFYYFPSIHDGFNETKILMKTKIIVKLKNFVLL